MMKKIVLLLAPALLLSACATFVNGSTQRIAVNTDPSGAHCAILRQGQPIADIATTPGSVIIDRTKYDVMIKCEKRDFDNGVNYNHSGSSPWVFGNLVLGGLIGWGIDSAVGADNQYASPVFIQLMPSFAPAYQYPMPEPVPAPVRVPQAQSLDWTPEAATPVPVMPVQSTDPYTDDISGS